MVGWLISTSTALSANFVLGSGLPRSSGAMAGTYRQIMSLSPLEELGFNQEKTLLYPLVNILKAVEHHHFEWVFINYFNWAMASIANC